MTDVKKTLTEAAVAALNPVVLPPTSALNLNIADMSADIRREVYVFLVLAGLVYRKDGSGTGTGLARKAIDYVDATLAELKARA